MRKKGGWRRTWRVVRRSLAVTLALGTIAIVALWLLFQHKPGWYHPVTVDDATVQRAQASTARLVDRISDGLAVSEPVEAILVDGEVNEWLASLALLWPEAGRAIPTELTDLAASFDSGLVRVGGHLQNGQLQAILNLSFAVSVTADGSGLMMKLDEVCIGSVQLPRGSLEELLERVRIMAGSDDAGSALEKVLSRIESVEELLEGIEVRNRFIWPNGERPFRISSITSHQGQLRMTLEPN